METEKKTLQGLGGNAWQTMSGRSLEAILSDITGNTAGVVSINEALQQAAYLICCDIIGQDIAKAPIQLRKRINNSTSEVVDPRTHKLARMFALAPNPRHTWREFSEMTAYWFALVTNAYIYVRRDLSGNPIALIPLQSSRVIDLALPLTGEVFYQITAATWQEQALLGFQSLRAPERDVIHVRGRMIDGFTGYSTLLAGQETLEIGNSIDSYRKRLFEDDAQLRGVFRKTTPGALDEVAFERLRRQFGELMKRFARNQEPIVLEDGIEFSAISSNPTEAELTKQLEASIVSTCRLLRIPPHKAFHLVNVKYENMEVLEKSYVGDTLEPILQLFEQRLTKHLLSEDERLDYFVSFDRNALALRDPKILIETTKGLMNSGGITIDEFRAAHGYNPIPGGNVRLVPVNMNVVDENNNIVIAAGAQPITPPLDLAVDDLAPTKNIRLAVNNQ